MSLIVYSACGFLESCMRGRMLQSVFTAWMMCACLCLSSMRLHASDHGLRMGVLDALDQRIAVNVYVTGDNAIMPRSEFAAISYDLSTDFSIVMGSSVSDPERFHYLDLSLHHPWTLFSWQTSFELGISRYMDNDMIKHRLSQSITLDYSLDEFFSLQILFKRFLGGLFTEDKPFQCI